MLNPVRKSLASTTMPEGSWSETTAIDDVPGPVREPKQQLGKDIFVTGSSELTQSLIHNQLIDEDRLTIHPVVLGTRKRLFREGAPARTLRLIDAITTTSGLVTLTYEPAEGGA